MNSTDEQAKALRTKNRALELKCKGMTFATAFSQATREAHRGFPMGERAKAVRINNRAQELNGKGQTFAASFNQATREFHFGQLDHQPTTTA